MLAKQMDTLKKIQSQTGYYHVAVITKHNDANAMLNLDQTSYASATTHTTLDHHKVPPPHAQYNLLNLPIAMIDTLQKKSKKKKTNILA